MSLKQKISGLITILGIVFLFIGLVQTNKKSSLNQDILVQKFISQAEKSVTYKDSLLFAFGVDSLNKRSTLELDSFSEKSGLDIIVSYQNKPKYWTTNDYSVKPHFQNDFSVIDQNGIYLAVWNRVEGDYVYSFIYNIFNLNAALIRQSNNEENQPMVFLSGVEFSGSKKIRFKGKWIPNVKENYFVQANLGQQDAENSSWIYAVIGFVFLFGGIYLIRVFSNYWIWGLLNNAILGFLIYLVSTSDNIGLYLQNFGFVDYPFNESLKLNTLSILLIALSLFSLTRICIKEIKVTNDNKSIYKNILISFFLAFTGFLLFIFDVFAICFITDLGIINFDPLEILVLDINSFFFGISVIMIAAASLNFLRKSSEFTDVHVVWRLFALLLVVVISTLFSGVGLGVLIFTFFGITWLSVKRYLVINNVFKKWLLDIVLPTILITAFFHIQLENQDQKRREELTSFLNVQYDNNVNEQLLEADMALKTDLVSLHMATETQGGKPLLESSLRQNYFTALNELFEISIFDFDALGKNLHQENEVDYKTLNSIYYDDGGLQITDRFFLLSNKRLRGSYIGKFDLSIDSNTIAHYFIVLTPNYSNSRVRLGEVLQPSKVFDYINRYGYSYAIYNQNKLSKRAGKFDYATYLNWEKLDQDGDGYYLSNGVEHIIRYDAFNNIIVVSQPLNGVINYFQRFTLYVLGVFFVAFVFYWLMWIRNKVLRDLLGVTINLTENPLFPSEMGIESWYISRRLQLYISWLILSIFILVVVLTFNFFTNYHSRKQSNELTAKAVNLASRISGQLDLDELKNKYEVGLLYDLAESVGVDINIFDKYGELIMSTNPRIFKEKFKSSLMNPYVFNKFKNNESSIILTNENISDLSYLSAYTVIADNNLDVRGFLNIPYYSNRQDLFRDVSSFLVTVINVFAVLFAITLLLTHILARRITSPLILIREKLSQMQLGEKNQELEWSRMDEVGLLVKEYNNMVHQLSESLNRLSEAERQGAWREMAKQVAHEIKNPLTPMRLSLQHLQFAMSRGDENIKEKMKNTIDLLIRQIDSLSSMAEEFSSFAKMPEPKLQEVDLNLIVSEAVQLIQTETGQEFECEVLEGQPIISADPHQLGRIFTNLLKNAIQAIPEKRIPKISVKISLLSNQNIQVKVEDNGKGIEGNLHSKIFSPNFSTKTSGMGLGLAITKKIIEQFGGTIHFETQMNIGTTFFVEFPLIKMGQ
ncbi:MAG: sensor histidine kinase [Bacteroidia bacterium]